MSSTAATNDPPMGTAATDEDPDSSPPVAYDLLVVGGGVVGLAVSRSAASVGYRVALVEREDCLLRWASGSNSGIVCTGADASPGTLERALIRDGISQIRPYCRQMNVPTRPCGSLCCFWPWDEPHRQQQQEPNEQQEPNQQQPENHENQDRAPAQSAGKSCEDRLREVLQESLDAGDTDARILSPDEILEMEPRLNAACLGGVYVPGEIVVDPWLLPISYAVQARECGADVYTGFAMDPARSRYDPEQQTWTIVSSSTGKGDGGEDHGEHPKRVRARMVVNAAGVWADLVHEQAIRNNTQQQQQQQQQQQEQQHVQPPPFASKPRRGQYRIFRSTDQASIRHPIQPVPTQRTKGIFVFSSLYDQIIVGPTALDQESRTDRTIDPRVRDELTRVAQRIVPGLNVEDDNAVGEYVGIRPATDQRDYQIHLDYEKRWLTCAGIRSTGLTASLGIGRHVVHLLQQVGFAPRTAKPQPPTAGQRCTPLPPVEALVRDYHRRNDGAVEIRGHVYRVTHPITKLGWDARSGIAAAAAAAAAAPAAPVTAGTTR